MKVQLKLLMRLLSYFCRFILILLSIRSVLGAEPNFILKRYSLSSEKKVIKTTAYTTTDILKLKEFITPLNPTVFIQDNLSDASSILDLENYMPFVVMPTRLKQRDSQNIASLSGICIFFINKHASQDTYRKQLARISRLYKKYPNMAIYVLIQNRQKKLNSYVAAPHTSLAFWEQDRTCLTASQAARSSSQHFFGAFESVYSTRSFYTHLYTNAGS